MVTQIEQMLLEAWGKFCDYYDTKAPQYRDICQLDKQQAREAHWICWDESDLMLHIGRFFYDILKEKKESLFSNIEMHFEKNVTPANFPGQEFENRLGELRERLNKWPKIDMIVAYEDNSSTFLLCAEVKHFHGPPNYHNNETPLQKIDADIAKLIAIRDLGIAKKVVFVLFDDYYWCNDENTANAIQQKLDEIRNENGITVLFHTSEAKLENY